MNLVTYSNFDQRTDLWHLARLGLPTTSRFKTVLAAGKKDAESLTRSRYVDDLAAELITGLPVERYHGKYMKRGVEWEPDALGAYIQETGATVKPVAFVRNYEHSCGASPDGLIGTDGGVEIKTMEPGLMVRLRCNPSVPSEHLPQIHGLMMVTGRAWWDVAIYSPGFKLYVERVHRDESYIREMLRFLQIFQTELEQRVFKATDEEQTYKALRKLRDMQFVERITEEQETEFATDELLRGEA